MFNKVNNLHSLQKNKNKKLDNGTLEGYDMFATC